MKKAYIIRQDRKLKTILNKTYNEAMAILKYRNPKARQLIEDEELSQLHDLLALLRLGHIRISNAEDDRGQFMLFEIKDTPTSF